MNLKIYENNLFLCVYVYMVSNRKITATAIYNPGLQMRKMFPYYVTEVKSV